MTRWKCCFGRLLDRWGDTTLLHSLKVGFFRTLSYPSYQNNVLFSFPAYAAYRENIPMHLLQGIFLTNHFEFPRCETGQGFPWPVIGKRLWQIKWDLDCIWLVSVSIDLSGLQQGTFKSNHWVFPPYETGPSAFWFLSPPLWPLQATLLPPTLFLHSFPMETPS